MLNLVFLLNVLIAVVAREDEKVTVSMLIFTSILMIRKLLFTFFGLVLALKF